MAGTPRACERQDQALSADQVLAIAQADAVKAYRDLSSYGIRLALESAGWHVEYQPKDPRLKDGGLRYLIDPLAGTVIAKTYEQ